MKTLFISNFPSGRWVATGQNGQRLTSECPSIAGLDFCRKNDTSPAALQHAIEFNWPSQMFQISEIEIEIDAVEPPVMRTQAANRTESKGSLFSKLIRLLH